MTDTLEVPEEAGPQHSLRGGVLGLFDSVIMGIAGVAPAYSLAASTAVLFGAVLLGGAASLLYCGIAMFGIVFAFSYLGRAETNAGASYSWVRRALHPALGFLSGWALIVSALIFMVAATVPAGSYILGLFSTSASNNTTDVTLVGAVFFLLMVAAVAAGVTITVTVQIVMSCIELSCCCSLPRSRSFTGTTYIRLRGTGSHPAFSTVRKDSSQELWSRPSTTGAGTSRPT